MSAMTAISGPRRGINRARPPAQVPGLPWDDPGTIDRRHHPWDNPRVTDHPEHGQKIQVK